ncbi:MAG: hypothetical protein O7D86_15285 [Proteobacteria bacterium]|nr:hypothetical protein [Pseudomonadota bacterium]
MHKLSKIICLIVLSSFTITASAASLLYCCDMTNKTDTQQNPVDTTSKNCHSDQNESSDRSINDCCQDMNLCNGSMLFVSGLSLVTTQNIQLAVQYPTNEHFVYNINSPPTPPPKLTT